MKKRIISIVLAAIMLFTLAPVAFAADREATTAAGSLNALGLFNGTGTDGYGNPIFDLDKALTRQEAVTMLVRLLGKEAEAKAGQWDVPFTDIDDWAVPYIGYAYANKLTNGTSDTTYDGRRVVTATEYLTLVLRALGYDSTVDFRWDKAWELSDAIGLTDGDYNENTKQFLRGDLTVVSINAMEVKQKDSSKTMADKLIADGVFTAEEYAKATEAPEVLREPVTDAVEVTFAVDGKKLEWDWGYMAAAGTYIVTPYYNGREFDEYEVEIEDGNAKVYKNGDGTFTVEYPAYGNVYITLWYDFEEHQRVDENGNVSISYSRTKRSFDFSPPVPDYGFVIVRKGCMIFPGTSFGNNYTPFFVFDVYYNGQLISDYSVVADSSAPVTPSVQADGSLLLMTNGWGRGNFTITYAGASAKFGVVN